MKLISLIVEFDIKEMNKENYLDSDHFANKKIFKVILTV